MLISSPAGSIPGLNPCGCEPGELASGMVGRYSLATGAYCWGAVQLLPLAACCSRDARFSVTPGVPSLTAGVPSPTAGSWAGGVVVFGVSVRFPPAAITRWARALRFYDFTSISRKAPSEQPPQMKHRYQFPPYEDTGSVRWAPRRFPPATVTRGFGPSGFTALRVLF